MYYTKIYLEQGNVYPGPNGQLHLIRRYVTEHISLKDSESPEWKS